MGMTIEEVIAKLNNIIMNPSCQITKEEHKALNIAINIIKSYDRIRNSYNERLKSDMVAMLEEINLEYDELDPNYECDTYYAAIRDCSNLIQQKINALKEDT